MSDVPPPRVRGRSSSAERRAAGILSRSDIRDFVRTLDKDDEFDVEWRMVDPARPFSADAVPWAKWRGEVKQFEAPNVVEVKYRDAQNQVMGLFRVPPDEVPNGYIEYKSLKKLPKPLATLQSTAKRQREETPKEEQSKPSEVRDLVEALNKEKVEIKIVVCEGLRVVETDELAWHPFLILQWVASMRDKDLQQQRDIVVTAWRMELLQSLTDFGFAFSSDDPAVTGAVEQYNTARELYADWLVQTPEMHLDTKRQWHLGFGLLFQLLASIVALKHGYIKSSQLISQLQAEYAKSNAVLDIPKMVGQIFRLRPRGQSQFARSRKQFQNSQPKKDQPKPGQPQTKICKFCHKPHTSAESGRNFWADHKC